MSLKALERIFLLREKKGKLKEDDDLDGLSKKDLKDIVRRLEALEDKTGDDAGDDDDKDGDDKNLFDKKSKKDDKDEDDDKGKDDKKKPPSKKDDDDKASSKKASDKSKDDDKDEAPSKSKKNPFEKKSSKDDDADDKKKPAAKKSDKDDDDKSSKKASKDEKKSEVAKDDDKDDDADDKKSSKKNPFEKKDKDDDKDDDEESDSKKASEKKPDSKKDALGQKSNTGKDKDDIAVDEPPDTTKVKVVIDPPKKLRPESKTVVKFATFIREMYAGGKKIVPPLPPDFGDRITQARNSQENYRKHVRPVVIWALKQVDGDRRDAHDMIVKLRNATESDAEYELYGKVITVLSALRKSKFDVNKLDVEIAESTTQRDVAYKGYLIRTHPFTGDIWIEKDKHRIAGAKSVEDAKKQIDMLTEQWAPGLLKAALDQVAKFQQQRKHSDYRKNVRPFVIYALQQANGNRQRAVNFAMKLLQTDLPERTFEFVDLACTVLSKLPKETYDVSNLDTIIESFNKVFNPATRQRAINNALNAISRKYHPYIPLKEIFKLLEDNGFQPVQEDGTPWEGLLLGREGRVVIELKDLTTNQMSNRTIALAWYKMDVSGRYEITAYMS